MPNLRRGMMAAASGGGPDVYQLWSWGSNGYGQLMIGDNTDRSSPVQIGEDFMGELDLETDGLNGIHSRIASGFHSTAAIKADGTLWTAGSNVAGSLGVGDTTNRSSPTQVGSLTNWKNIVLHEDVMTALKTDGTLWGWGYFYKVLGQPSGIVSYSSPVQIGSDTDWAFISSNANNKACAALKTDGSLYMWGDYGAYWGQGASDSYEPVEVGDKDYVFIGCGVDIAGAVQSDGTMWTWGTASYGQQGHGDALARSSPTQLGSNTDWYWATGQIKASMFYSNTSGGLFGVGRNDDGVFGISGSSSSPVAVGGMGAVWASGGHGMADQFGHGITDANGDNTGGQAWALGGTQAGVGVGGVGEADPTFSSPIQIGTDTDWLCVSPHGGASSNFKLAIKKA